MKAGLSQHTQLKQELKINPRLYQAMDLLYMKSGKVVASLRGAPPSYEALMEWVGPHIQ